MGTLFQIRSILTFLSLFVCLFSSLRTYFLTRCNSDLLIYKISSTCFGQYFAHHQERETEIFTAYGILLLWWVGRR